MKLLLAGVLGWTAALVPLVLFVPSHLSTPGCAGKVGMTVECAAQMATENQAIFWRDTFPFLATVVAGYVLVAVVALALALRARGRAP